MQTLSHFQLKVFTNYRRIRYYLFLWDSLVTMKYFLRTEFKHKLGELETQWNSVMDRMRQRKNAIDEGIKIWMVYTQKKNRFVKWTETSRESVQNLEYGMKVGLSLQGIKSDLDKLAVSKL